MCASVSPCVNQINTLGRMSASCLCHSGQAHWFIRLVAVTGALEYPKTNLNAKNGNKKKLYSSFLKVPVTSKAAIKYAEIVVVSAPRTEIF